MDGINKIKEVHIHGHTILKIVHYCDSNPHQAGWLLGYDDANKGTVSVSFPLPWFKCDKKGNDDIYGAMDGNDDHDDNELGLKEKNVMIDAGLTNSVIDCINAAMLVEDLNVGFFTAERIMDPVVVNKFEFSYSNNPNSIMIVYDAKQSKLGGSLVLRAYRFSERYIQQKIKGNSKLFIKADDVFEELPLYIYNNGHMAALVRTCADLHESDLNNQDKLLNLMDSEDTIQRHLNEIERSVEKFTEDQSDVLRYLKQVSDPRLKRINWLNSRQKENIELKKDGGDLLSMKLDESGLDEVAEVKDSEVYNIASMNVGHLNTFATDLNTHVNMSLKKIFLSEQFNRDDAVSSSKEETA